jgi:putative CRISPR-associated protein (TIGR02619 family)
MRNRLISTVGTSLFANIRSQYREDSGVSKETHNELAELLNSENWGQLARCLTRIEPTARICGAEINSVEEAVKRGRVELNHIHFLVSDTKDGKNTGKLLESYLNERRIDGLQTVKYHVIDDLQDEKPPRFKTFGLRNLVRQIGDLVQRYQAANILIDATGGYKAQIAIAVDFGQALGIPVLYRFERFSEIINIPPMPISFDYGLLGENADLLATFERGNTLTLSEIDDLDEKIRVLLEEVEVDGESLFALGAVGQIFLTGFRLRFPGSQELQAVSNMEKRAASFRDDHYPNGFKEFVQRLCNEVAWVKTARSLPYHKQRSIKGIGFYVREGRLVGTFQDKGNFGARFEILTNATTQDQLTWAADQLNQLYGNG